MSQIKVLPFIAIFNESAVIDHMVGFEDLGNNVRRSTPSSHSVTTRFLHKLCTQLLLHYRLLTVWLRRITSPPRHLSAASLGRA